MLVTHSLTPTTADALVQAPYAIPLDGRVVAADKGSPVQQALAVREGLTGDVLFFLQVLIVL